MVDFGMTCGSIQHGIRPALILQNNIGNKFSPTTIVCPITSKKKKQMPTHATIESQNSGLQKDSIALCEQITTIDKTQLMQKVGELKQKNEIEEVNKKIMTSFGFAEGERNV